MKARLVLKIVATVALVAIFVFLSVIVIVMAPLYLALALKGKAKVSAIIEIIPLAIIASGIWKLWKPEGMSDTEKAYYDGIIEGQVKASKHRGVQAGMKMIAERGDLSPKPVYSMRKGKSNLEFQGEIL